MIDFAPAIASALNRLLQAETWARARLAPFAEETLELRAPPLPTLRLTIASDGALAAAAPSAEAALVVILRPDALAAAMKGEDHLLRSIDVAGNAKLAAEVMFLARHLRWDAEEALSKVVGDAVARRLAGLARDAIAWHAEAARRIAGSLVEYAVEEKQLLVRRADLETFAGAHARLRDDLERLEKRVQLLDGAR
ncbi:MAG: hypothetical protein H7Y16_06745 [Candidatus Parcubacteria bacterium]|nr:hypothetical protein [Burkholderiales bacterium]